MEDDVSVSSRSPAGVDGDDQWEIHVDTCEELKLAADVVKDVTETWSAFVQTFDTEQAAGEAAFSAIFDAAPSLQSLFHGPRAVQAQKFVLSLGNIISKLDHPAALKVEVETLGFAHLSVDITIPRIALFRDAILDLFEVELGDAFTPTARDGWGQLLSYVGGSQIWIRTHFSARLKVLQESWKAANNRENPQVSDAERQKMLKQTKKDHKKNEIEIDPEVASTDSPDSSESSFSGNTGHTVLGTGNSTKVISDRRRCGNCLGTLLNCCKCCSFGKEANQKEKQDDGMRKEKRDPKPKDTQKSGKSQLQAADVPRTFTEMFQWNCAVMGLSGRRWMQEILSSFTSMVEHIADMRRLQQECNLVSIRIAKVTAAGVNWVNLSEFKSCMLAALRSLLPTVWDTTHEVAWNWLWDNIETILKSTMGKPLVWEQSLVGMFAALSDEQLFNYRVQLYERFFAAVPAGQDYFKQSNTRLHFIAESATNMSLKLLQDPWRMVDDVSALGLRHVGYGIPTEMFGPFTEAAVDALRGHVDETLALEAFNWSLSIISQMLVHTVTEGSTIVMKAINNNSVTQLVKAVSCAPRGERSNWVLIVKVGTQDISPFRWAIESGSLSAAKAIIEDLLAIRADRQRYYYGVDDLFQRHPDIIKILCSEAPMLLPTLLEGLIWRSRIVTQGARRVNYYVKNLVVAGSDRAFAGALPALVALGDPKIISHVAVDLVANLLWSGIVMHEFITSKLWFIASLVILMVSQTLLPEYRESFEVRVVTFVCRVLTYALTLLRLLVQHSRDIFLAYYRKQTVRIFKVPLPKYLTKTYDLASFLLLICLILMWANEPFIWCYDAHDWPTEYCLTFEDGGFIYSVFAMCAVGLHWGLMADLAVFSTGLSAFVLVCVHVGSEIGRFMFALMFLLTAFASSITVLEHHYEDMKTVGDSLIALTGITLRLYEDDYRDLQNDALLLTAVFCFVTASAILLLNLLIAQLNCSYVYIYQNMLGYAKLKRSSVTVQTLAFLKIERWSRFVATLGLDVPLEFNEGDVGMAGGICVFEPPSQSIVATDRILRFGGSCSPDLEWPADTTKTGMDADEEQLEALEQLLHATLHQLRKSKRGEHGSGFNASSQTPESGKGISGYSGVSGISALSSD
mmetsp:Transcript_33986/g.79147  ORF Transcript_33986/g.79147 Transcript_33986/m.79147 type:complete len:1138 (-) Transcript_33986:44-3457(-)